MGPSEIEELLEFEPFVPLRLTLSSGDVIEVHDREGLSVNGLSLTVNEPDAIGTPGFRLISLPNIAMIEPILLNSRSS